MSDEVSFPTLQRLEREYQEGKWGQQDHRNDVWLAILTEEVGEAAKAILEHSEIKEELVQVAAVAQAWAEAIARNKSCECRLCNPQ